MQINKITYITYHNWETKRHGGFHQLAEYTVSQGINTVFFSFSRPYYIIFKREERLNASILRHLSKGAEYVVGSHIIKNITWPTFALPGFMRKFLSNKINKWLMTNSFESFDKFAKKCLEGTDCFVFESCDAVFLADLIKNKFPNSIIVYRPSDPLVDFSNDKMMNLYEGKLLKLADLVFTVNEESIKLYEEEFFDVFDSSKAIVLKNGVHLKDYQKKYECPDALKNVKSALYVGAFDVDWDLIFYTASKLPDIKFVIVTPVSVKSNILRMIDKHNNVDYIPGIKPSDVPKYITNATLIIQPYPKKHNFHNKRSMGLTSQNYKAISANKKIITHMCPKTFSDYGLITTYNYDDFCSEVSKNINCLSVNYKINLEELDWKCLCEKFLTIMKSQQNV